MQGAVETGEGVREGILGSFLEWAALGAHQGVNVGEHCWWEEHRVLLKSICQTLPYGFLLSCLRL